MLSELGNILEELTAAGERISAAQVDAMCRQIQAHPRCFFSGSGRTGLMLEAFAMRLTQAGKTAFIAGAPTTPAIRHGDLLVAASASGQTMSAVSHARTAKEAGADLFLISAVPCSALSQIQPVSLLLETPTKTNPGGTQPLGSLFEQLLLLILDAAVIQMTDKNGFRATFENHANLE